MVSVKTPCQTNPEMWVGDDPKARKWAAAQCQPCPARTGWCGRLAAANATKRKPDPGVIAGIDFTHAPNKGGRPPTVDKTSLPTSKTCEHCGRQYTKNGKTNLGHWVRQRFCGRQCARLATLKRNRMARAA